MNSREMLEQLEKDFLSPFACRAADSRGREFPLEPCPLRTDFMRDRDRIIHSKSFRRLKHKTQVYIAPSGDHYRTRLTHTLEVCQIARTIAKALRLNEDLAEAIALGHDLGHTPFGHAGERALNALTSFGFDHNLQSLRVVDKLEPMNLTCEVRDGILNHTGDTQPITLEGMCVRLADRVAYINHDIDDSVRAGVMAVSDIPEDLLEFLGETHSTRIGRAVGDIVAQGLDAGTVRMSEDMRLCIDALRSFMFNRVYRSEAAEKEEGRVRAMMGCLFDYFTDKPSELPDDLWLVACNEGVERAVCDFIAGMTDSYAVNVFLDRFVPIDGRTL